MAEDLISRAYTEHTPLIDGHTVTFVWQGDHAPRLIADFNAWGEAGESSETEMQPAGDNLWTLSVTLPENAYVEYALIDGDDRPSDPFNPRRVSNGMGKYNHYFYMPAAHPTPLVRTRRGVPRGQVTSEVLKTGPFTYSGSRRVHFYQPPVDEPCPLLVVWDGEDYLKRALLPAIVDNLIYEGRIRPIALAMPENGGQARMLEYGCADMTLGFIAQGILPQAKERLNLLDIAEHPGSYGIMGASMGGLMALYSGLRLPEMFGKVLAQSGAYSFPGFDFVVWELVRAKAAADIDIWMDCGTMEWLNDANRNMAAQLQFSGYHMIYHEYQGGHNYRAWRDDLVAGLEWLFGPR